MLDFTNKKLVKTYNPIARAEAMVINGNARFTILTSQLIRMEWDSNAQFEDNTSFVFVNRHLPVPAFTCVEDKQWLTIQTEKLTLYYKKNSGSFTKENLKIIFLLNDEEKVWHPDKVNTGNLGGTNRTLDRVEGETQIEPGLISRDGWAVVDDSERPLLDNSEWPWVMARPIRNQQDWYFFGYGHDYKKALYDFTQVAGKIPLPPRFVFGIWWSRYWPYTDKELKQLVNEFDMHHVPLDVLVIDMDWHITFLKEWWKKEKDQAGERKGWTGFTWNQTLFPDPEAFLRWVKSKGLKVTLNLHPASGIQPHEEAYPEIAKAMGIDPETQQYVPFDIVGKTFASQYMEKLLRPLEKQGVDFWWLDWQQWSTTTIPGMNPTMWLNYVHFTDMERKNKIRPLIFHRWGGLGNHRYPIGFSGDTVSVWKSLAFQPHFTATAANVGCAYWSHDIGGHMPGPISGELYTRWLQFGAFSPVLRTHSAKHALSDRRIWSYSHDYFLIMREAFLLRQSLIPYIYTAARHTYDTGLAMCRPMYYEYPEVEEAYIYKNQYMFGNDMFVSPITEALSEYTQLAHQRIWIPEGEWIEWYSGKRFTGPTLVNRGFALDEIPIYVRAGAIIPMQSNARNSTVKNLHPVILTFFPGAGGTYKLYEDEGNSTAYQDQACSWTTISQRMPDKETLLIKICPVKGSYPGMLTKRSYELRLKGILPPKSVFCNGEEIFYSQNVEDSDSISWQYNGDQVTTIVHLPYVTVNESIEIRIKLSVTKNSSLLDGVPGIISRLTKVMNLINKHATKTKDWSPDILVEAAQTGNRITLRPHTTKAELEKLSQCIPPIIKEIMPVEGDSGVEKLSVMQLRALLSAEANYFAPRKE